MRARLRARSGSSSEAASGTDGRRAGTLTSLRLPARPPVEPQPAEPRVTSTVVVALPRRTVRATFSPGAQLRIAAVSPVAVVTGRLATAVIATPVWIPALADAPSGW